jgi:predicted oxidoreductase
MRFDCDVIVVGAGLSGLVAAAELADSGKRIIIIEQSPEEHFGGQAHWSFGGLFFVDSPEQRRLRIRDSLALATEDWTRAAGFDRDDEDACARKWAHSYLEFASGEKRAWLHAMGVRWFPIVGWAERAFNSVPRFHITWGTGPGLLAPFVHRVREAQKDGRIYIKFRHRVDDLVIEGGAVTGVRGTTPDGEFEIGAQAVVIASGGIGANAGLVRKNWPSRLGPPPAFMVQGVPDYVDGRMLQIAQSRGARIANRDRMWHYTEGLRNWNPIWTNHGIRILPGPSALWLDAMGNRLPAPLFPGFDTLGTLEYIGKTGFDYTWFILDQATIKREFALSGSEQNPDLANRDWRGILGRAFSKSATPPVEAFKAHSADFIVRDTLEALIEGMNALTEQPLLTVDTIRHQVEARNEGSDLQIAAIRRARRYIGDRLIRTVKPHDMLDPKYGPLIAVKLSILTRKTLGGLQTDLDCRVFGTDGDIISGLYAIGEAAGFGGGGMHGYRSLEGTFLGGCLFTGLRAGRAIAKAL